MSESLSSLFDREQIALVAYYNLVTRANRSLTKSNVCDWFVFWGGIALSLFDSQKRAIRSKIRCFHHVFDSFSLLFPVLCPRANRSRRSSLRHSFLKSKAGAIRSWKRANRYFAHKKTKDLHKKQKANSQPCFSLTNQRWERFSWKIHQLFLYPPGVQIPWNFCDFLKQCLPSFSRIYTVAKFPQMSDP